MIFTSVLGSVYSVGSEVTGWLLAIVKEINTKPKAETIFLNDFMIN
jgi:hypothetical protein